MPNPVLDERQRTQIATFIEAMIRVGVLLMIALLCLQIVKPFLIPVLWGAILAVALFPVFEKVRAWLGGRNGLSAALLSLVLIAVIIIPTVMISASLVEALGYLAESVSAGDLAVPPPPPGVADWPVIGPQAYDLWNQAATNLGAFVKAFESELVTALSSFVGLLASAGTAVLLTIVSIAIAAAFMASSQTVVRGLKAFGIRLAAEKGEKFVGLSGLVIKSVAGGVIGVAVIQAVLGGIGFYLAGVPFAGLWTLILLMLSIAQIPALILMLPLIAYVFATADGLTATVFAVWSLVAGVSDGFLKPLLLGRGVDIPTLVILIGAIGGMVYMGIIGLFIGAIILALGWELLVSWVRGEIEEPELEESEDDSATGSES